MIGNRPSSTSLAYGPGDHAAPTWRRLFEASKQGLKAPIKAGAYLAARALPSGLVQGFIDRHGRAPSRSGQAFWFIDRAFNYVNRRLATRLLRDLGVPCFVDGPGTRNQVFQFVLDRHVVEPVDYLEFGVYRGDSIAWWLARLSPASDLYGFDSFEGLPEDWNYRTREGEFDCRGAVPALRAANLRFITGLFEETLEPFLVSTVLKPRLIVHFDADLYSSTIYVLRTIQPLLIPGTIVVFDEYWDIKHEFRALRDFVRETGKTFEYLAITNVRAAIRFTA